MKMNVDLYKTRNHVLSYEKSIVIHLTTNTEASRKLTKKNYKFLGIKLLAKLPDDFINMTRVKFKNQLPK